MAPVAISMTLAPSVTADLRRTRIHTNSAQIHKTGKDHDPEVHAIDYVTTIELREPALYT